MSSVVAPTAAAPVKKIWPTGPVLNQGRRGACVGFGFTCEIISEPAGNIKISTAEASRFAIHLWRRAKVFAYGSSSDRWKDDSAGTTMQSGAVTLREFGLIEEFYWADSIEDVRNAILTQGPVVMAMHSFSSLMSDTDRHNNFKPIKRSEDPDSAHCMCIIGFDPKRRFKQNGVWVTEPAYLIRNSWGKSWGRLWTTYYKRNRKGKRVKRVRFGSTGSGWMRETDLAFVLEKYGWNFGSAVLMIGRVDPDTLGSLDDIIARHPIMGSAT